MTTVTIVSIVVGSVTYCVTAGFVGRYIHKKHSDEMLTFLAAVACPLILPVLFGCWLEHRITNAKSKSDLTLRG